LRHSSENPYATLVTCHVGALYDSGGFEGEYSEGSGWQDDLRTLLEYLGWKKESLENEEMQPVLSVLMTDATCYLREVEEWFTE
jgi:hypothetical protein